MRRLYIMMIGLPACGKSTIVKEILSKFPDMNFHITSTDDYIEKEAAWLGLTYNDVFDRVAKDAEKDMLARREEAFFSRRNIIHDQTNLTEKGRAKKLASIPKDYIRMAIVCDIDESTRAERAAARVGKIIPEKVIEQMRTHFVHPNRYEFDVIVTAEQCFTYIKLQQELINYGERYD